MRTKWGFLLAAGVLAVAGGAGFLILNPPTTKRAGGPAPRDDSPPLQIADVQDSLTTEFGFEGQRDFPFENRRDHPVTVGVELKDCLCARVQICRTPDAALGPRSALAWETLEQEGRGFEVPARGAGLLRLEWKGKRVGDQRYWARLWVDDEGNRLFQRIEVIVQVVLPVVIRAEDQPKRTDVDIGPLNAGAEQTARFICVSGTRPHFTLTPAPPQADPCLSYGPPQRLTEAELKTLSEKMAAPVLSGYRVTVTVREKAGGAQLDIGPFRRPVAWNTDVAPGHQVSSIVSANVQGEVKLAGATSKPFVDLGKISPNDPVAVDFTLESADPRLELKVDEKNTLDFLAAELIDGKEGKKTPSGKSWRVRVLYRKESEFRGKFPNRDRAGYDTDVACSIVFHIVRQPSPDGAASQPVRRLFVPVRGVVPISN